MSRSPQDFRPPEGPSTALLVIDVQEKLCPAMDPNHVPRLLKAARVLLETARQKGWRVLASEQYPQGLGATLPELAQELTALDARPVAKTAFSAWRAEGMQARLADARAVVLLGMETHVCVLETALDLLGAGKVVFVPWDAVGSRREEDRTTALDLLRAAGAIVTSSETLAFQSLGSAGGPAFKAISGKVR